MKKQLRILLLALFFLLIGYIFYLSPQIILSDSNWPDSVKLSGALCGIILGVLYFTKEKLPPEEKHIEPEKKGKEEK